LFVKQRTGVLGVYFGGLIGTKDVDRGPIITLVWAAYFTLVWLLHPEAVPEGTFISAFFIFYGLIGYRLSKAERDDLVFSYILPACLGFALIIINALI
jgi:hypothetical protein